MEYSFTVEAEKFIQIRFCLNQKTNGVMEEKGEGNFLLNCNEIRK